MRINEVSPNNLKGSFTKDLIISKLWSIDELHKIRNRFDTIYILGSWYGNLSLMIINKHLQFKKIINVELDNKVLKTGKRLAKKLGIDKNIEDMHKDANDLDYRQLTDNSVVINTSTTNMENDGWFDNIPKGTLLALQARNNDSGAVNQYENLESFSRDYPMSKILYKDQLTLKDPETGYERYMIIGIK
jgi:hypothetical protein